MISRSFQTVRRMREAWKWETYVRSQSFSSESAVKYLHIGRRKIQISPPPGEQDQSNALPFATNDKTVYLDLQNVDFLLNVYVFYAV